VERPITVDQTNVSVVVGGRAVVKWLSPPVPVPHPGLELLAHLREVGFAEMPPLLGELTVDGAVVAVVTGFIPGARDGWDWFVDELTGWVDGVVAADAVIASAERIGALAARLHAALATPSSVLPEPVGTAPVAAEAARGRVLLDAARGVSDRNAAALVRRLDSQLTAAIAELDCLGDVAAQRVHGDLHVGQMLRGDDAKIFVTDFDGNPLVDPASRRALRPVAVDVAALVQSVDHAGRIAQKRRPAAAARLEALIATVVTTVLSACTSGHGRPAQPEVQRDSPLWGLRVVQELHELVYADRHLPDWTYAPVATLTAMITQS
jgi:maltokinase